MLIGTCTNLGLLTWWDTVFRYLGSFSLARPCVFLLALKDTVVLPVARLTWEKNNDGLI